MLYHKSQCQTRRLSRSSVKERPWGMGNGYTAPAPKMSTIWKELNTLGQWFCSKENFQLNSTTFILPVLSGGCVMWDVVPFLWGLHPGTPGAGPALGSGWKPRGGQRHHIQAWGDSMSGESESADGMSDSTGARRKPMQLHGTRGYVGHQDVDPWGHDRILRQKGKGEKMGVHASNSFKFYNIESACICVWK